MKLLLSSAGATNPSIHAALVSVLPKPIEECAALAITTSSFGYGRGPERAYSFITGVGSQTPMVELGWGSVGVLELSALPLLGRDHWEPWVRAADVLLVNGGDPMFLRHWVAESGLLDVATAMPDLVWFGLSAGSMVLTPRIGEDFVNWVPPTGADSAMGVVDFSIFPHLDHPQLTENTMAAAEQWAAGLGNPAYAIDDATAIVVDGDRVEVVSEGAWRRFEG